MTQAVSTVGLEAAAELAALHATAFDAPWDAAAFESLLAGPGVFALTVADGLILCRVVADEAEILTVAVRPQARGEGRGHRLVTAAAELARASGAERLFLEVAEDNAAARALYARTGFVEIGRRRAYYAARDGGRTDALILSLTLV